VSLLQFHFQLLADPGRRRRKEMIEMKIKDLSPKNRKEL